MRSVLIEYLYNNKKKIKMLELHNRRLIAAIFTWTVIVIEIHKNQTHLLKKKRNHSFNNLKL